MTDTKKTKERSPSFPFIPLEDAIGRLKDFEVKFGRHPAPASKAGLAWGMKDGSSQAFQTLAALKAFGLLEYEGSAKDRKALISDTGRNYLRAQQDSIKKKILQEIALKPTQIAKFWGVWGRQRPPDPVCLDMLILENAFTEGAAQTFLKVYDQTLEFAELRDGEHKEELQQSDERHGHENDMLAPLKAGDLVHVLVGGVLQTPKPVRIRALRAHDGEDWYFVDGSETGLKRSQVEFVAEGKDPAADVVPPMLPLEEAEFGSRKKLLEEKISLDEGEVVLRWPARLSAASVEDLEDWLSGVIRRAKRRAAKDSE